MQLIVENDPAPLRSRPVKRCLAPLRSRYGQAGIISVTKKDLKDAEGRAARHGELPEELRGQADLLEEQLVLFEKQLAGMKEQVAARVRSSELAPYVMSIPGIGIDIAGVLLAYLGEWLLMKRRDYYRGMNNAALGKKLRYYKIEKMAEEAVSA